jgi:hypothetical protein
VGSIVTNMKWLAAFILRVGPPNVRVVCVAAGVSIPTFPAPRKAGGIPVFLERPQEPCIIYVGVRGGASCHYFRRS